MKSGLRTISKVLIVFFTFTVCFSSCYVRTEGCLDSNATNYDVYADDDCCCTYPAAKVNIVKEVDGASYVSTDTFTNALGQRYQITAQSFYISNLDFTYADGSTSEVVDTLVRDIPVNTGNEVIIEDNFGLIRQTSIAYNVGSIKENGDITAVSFQIGLTDEIDMLVPAQMSSSHPLGANNAADHYVEGQGYVFLRWAINVIEPIGVDAITLNIAGDSFPKEVVLATSQTVAPSVSTVITLVIDYGRWLEGIDFAADLSVIESQIIANTTSAFSLQ